MDPDAIGRALASEPGVVEVHDLHVWEVTTDFPALAAHVMVAPGDDCHRIRRELQSMLGERFGIRHTTLQVDHERADELLDIEPRASSGRTSKAAGFQDRSGWVVLPRGRIATPRQDDCRRGGPDPSLPSRS